MSDAPRMPLIRAQRAAEALMIQWGMSESTCLIAGSVRRRCLECGDIDLVAPAPTSSKDALWEAISATVVGDGTLYTPERAFTEHIKGLKRGFLSCSLRAQLGGVEQDAPVTQLAVIPVQVNRYTEANRGWTELRCTGPREFGIWFLVAWKLRYGIPVGEDHPASVEGHLVDPHKRVVPVTNEREAFEKCGLDFIEPHLRDSFMAQQQHDRSRRQREAMR